ncbi:MAG: NusG domain II-containing protein [Prevotella sp.]|nr:NusG domain II-containing protein [Staphylococcus sp.]MCM1350714.1 NusG domain II-containing protein [Prevotella sp.]
MIQKYKKDIILIVAILGVALLLFALFQWTKKPGKYVVITQNGKEIAKYALNEDRQISIPYQEGKYNVLVIQNQKAYISTATCPDQLCVKQRSISKVNETLVCLPNKMVVKIIGDEQSNVDVVSGKS